MAERQVDIHCQTRSSCASASVPRFKQGQSVLLTGDGLNSLNRSLASVEGGALLVKQPFTAVCVGQESIAPHAATKRACVCMPARVME